MKQLNILVSSAGRRVALMESIRDSLHSLGYSGKVCAIDCSTTAPALQAADDSWLVPPCDVPGFAEEVLHLSRRNNIGLVIPTIDTELGVYANAKGRFAAAGITLSVSSPETVEICADKGTTNEWLLQHDFPCVRTCRADDAEARCGMSYPLIVKPARGSASQGVRLIDSADELSGAALGQGMLIQEKAEGVEYTVNFFVDSSGKCLAAVPHQRLEVRSGEVSKGITRRHARVIEMVRTLAETLPGAYGALNAQGFLDSRGEFRLFELNARFGGGYPLTHRAGARFTDWLITDCTGGRSQPRCDQWSDGLAMLRYDAAVFVDAAELTSK